MMWDILNSAGRALLTLLAIYKLAQFREMMIPLERLGLGMMGGGSFLTIAVIWERQRSPFDGWSVTVLTVGAVLFLAGRTWRDRRHQRANEMQVHWHKQWKEQRR
jgi:hypothetical protein